MAAATPPTSPAAAANRPHQALIEIEYWRVGASTTPMTARSTADGHGVIGKAEVDALHAALAKDAAAKLIALPSLVTEAGQEASIVVGETIGPDVPGRTGQEPLSFAGGDNWTGLRAAAIPTQGEGADAVRLAFTFAHREAPPMGAQVDLAAVKAAEESVRAMALALRPGETAVLEAKPATTAGADASATRAIVLVSARWIRSGN